MILKRNLFETILEDIVYDFRDFCNDSYYNFGENQHQNRLIRSSFFGQRFAEEAPNYTISGLCDTQLYENMVNHKTLP